MTGTDATVATDVQAFATAVLGRPLWPHQLELARSPARYRVVCAGRQVGKSTLLAVIALHEAATRRNTLTLIVSAGETASRRLLEEAAGLATGSPLLRGSVLDESKSSLSLSNGSRVISVPASQRQIRGWPVDLLIVDEAGFVDQDVWRSAEPSIIARPGSRVILSSSPWGTSDHFFRALWSRGMDSPDEQVAAWHWPSSISPLVDQALLEQIKARETADYFEREFEARWTDESGSYFTEAELMKATVDYRMTAPEELPNFISGGRDVVPVAGGVDYGVARDANAVTLVGLLGPDRCGDQRWRLFLPWMKAEYGWPWNDFLDYLTKLCHAYGVRILASETNGVGAWPTDDLAQRVHGVTGVAAVWTDLKRKQSGFGKIKMLLQGDRLILPRHPELLSQLRALTQEQLPGGGIRISVPERSGHDDLCMSLMQAISCAGTYYLQDQVKFGRVVGDDTGAWVSTNTGVHIPAQPIPARHDGWIGAPSGREKGEVW